MNRKIHSLLGLAVLLLAFGASNGSALAAPQLNVSLERDTTYFPTVYHSDERVDFNFKVENSAPKLESVIVGQTLTCDPNAAEWGGEPTFTFKWLSGGTQVGTGATYEVQASDAGQAMQCLAIGENVSGASVSSSLPLQVVPVPSPLPPAFSGSTELSAQPRPRIGEPAEPVNVGDEITCTAPSSWTGSPSWTFQWLRNGGPANGEVTATTATTSTYKVAAADVPGALQCMAIAKTGSGEAPNGGTAVTISSPRVTAPQPSPFPPFDSPFSNTPSWEAHLPFIVDPNTTTGPITVDLELPGGEQTYGLKALAPFGGDTDWSCTMIPASATAHAQAVCKYPFTLRPGESSSTVKVITALGPDAPDLGTTKATAYGGGAATASEEISFPIEPPLPFGLSNYVNAFRDAAGNPYLKAGGHFDSSETDFELNIKRTLEVEKPRFEGFTGISKSFPVEELRQLAVELPPGFIGNPEALPALCPSVEDVRERTCPPASQIGGLEIDLWGTTVFPQIFAMEPTPGAPAEFAFSDGQHVYTLAVRLRPKDGYAIDVELSPSPEVGITVTKTKFCGYGVAIPQAVNGEFICNKASDVGANAKPFFTAPTHCGVPLQSGIRISSWTHPNYVDGPKFANGTIEGCEEVPFEPSIEAKPTTTVADSPTGLDVELAMPTEGLEKKSECHEKQGDPSSPLVSECISQANLRNVEVKLPKGLAINPAGANGLEACSPAQIGLGSNAPVTCPVGSRIGSVEVVTPLLEKPLDGAVYQAEQNNNPFGSTIAIYLLAERAKSGVRIKLPGKVELDPQTGQLTSTFAENPQLPFEKFKLKFFGGAAAPLRTPELCGTYSTTSVLTPWSAPQSGDPVTDTDTYPINQAPNGDSCPTSEAALPNAPQFDAGTVTPVAGAYSPLVVRLRREDGTQRFSSLDVKPPPGLIAKLAGTSPCSEAALANAATRTGKAEQGSPSCPASSHIGTAHVATGAGPAPYWATGQVYLAGPYEGAPLSLAVITPAVAGPFDLGTVVVRAPVHIDPTTAEISVQSDPLPQMLDGIPLDVRTIAVDIDKPDFSLNGTNCDPLAFTGQALSALGQAAPLAERFQLGECANLGFKPKLALWLTGGTHRGDYQGLRATVEARPGDANVAGAAVTLPHQAFVAQNHFRTVCTRVQFAADQCPAGSIYGRASATTPIFGYPLSGPVYLRSSDHPLPDLVVKLRGPDSQPIEVDLAGHNDSVKGALRNTFEVVPDAPVTKFSLELFGGKRGLIEISTNDYCAQDHRASAIFSAQNGLQRSLHPLVRNTHCTKAKHKKPSAHHRAPAHKG